MQTPSEQSYREIPLTQGQVARVSTHRFEELNAYSWHAWWNKGTRSFYAVRKQYLGGGKANPKYETVYMHRQLLGLPYGDPVQGDHENHDTLDNTDDNLRRASHTNNQRNQRKRQDNTSGFKGVSFYKRTGKWQAYIHVDGKFISLGYHATPELAHAAYCEAATRLHGEFALL